MQISGKVVFITGAAQGLGKAYAEALLEHGAKVAFGDVNAALGTATYQEFQRRFGEENVAFFVFDVTDHNQFRDAFNAAVSIFGHVDVFVNNAGIMDESKWELMIRINYTAVVFGTRLAIEHMRKDKGGRGGRIINISSRVALFENIYVPVYCGTKHAVRSYTSSLSQQPNMEELGVEFATFCPGGTVTELMLNSENKVQFFDEFKRIHLDNLLETSIVVNAFMELVQLEKMNGAILLIALEQGKYYRKMQNVVCA
ncbi:unnamed protein product [Candidula unifasciata]|uniref:15-hydroxyprostaglandin dehydrogenase [NAD(+)] n=1 Tax=Candidula unifasciata TaxID=100452 RepID=A0A8S3YBT4_9EUPU|nr:unnamed protein product [Candidula unifasciata]